MRIRLSIVLVFVLAGTVHAQEVAYEKYQLENGMTVILHEDHSLPVACINLWYYVGSKDEADRRSGFAHLFEHLMFMGTRRAPEGAFDTIMEGGGGFNNASTAEDRTNYFSFGPGNLLPTLLWLDADRLEDLGKSMTLDKLNKQRDVVRNERRQTSEMQPYGKAELMVAELMFPHDHPYGHTVIGSHEDLEAATVDDVKNFFATYYVPNNCSMVVAGDFKPAEIKPQIEKWFGSLPRCNDPIHKQAKPVRLSGVQRITFTDSVQFPRVYMIYHSPAHYGPGDAEMDLAAAVLSSGKSSRLYKRLVYEDKIATDVSVDQESRYLGSLFNIVVTAKQDIPLEHIEAAVDDEIAKFIKDGPTADELKRQQASIEYAMLSGLQSLLNKADQLNEYQFYRGEPNSFKWDLDRFKVDASAVRSWAGKVLTPDARLIMHVLPETGKLELADRDTQPTIADAASFAAQMPETFKLSNGITVKHWQRSELPLVQVDTLLNGGACEDPADKAGLHYLTASMLDEGAGNLGALEYSDALDLLGATVTASADRMHGEVELSVLKRNLGPALSLYADAILRPKFDPKEWDRVRSLHLESLKQDEDQPVAVAGLVGMRCYFGDGHSYGRPVDGTLRTVPAISLDDVKACHAQQYIPANATILSAGDLTADEMKAALEKALGDWKGAAGAHPATLAQLRPAAENPLRVVLVDKPGSVQTVIRFFMPGPAYSSPERPKLQLLGTILGGSFTSRLNQNLREAHGYTYGARCSYVMDPTIGYFSSGASVQAAVTGPALQEFLNEFHKIIGGDISPEETAKSRLTRRTNLIQSFQGLNGLLNTATVLEMNHLPFSALGEELAAVANVKANELNGLAKTSIPLDHALIVLVGDRKMILDQLKKLDLPTPEERTLTGDPVPGNEARGSAGAADSRGRR